MNVLAICERARATGYKVLIGGAAADDLFSGTAATRLSHWRSGSRPCPDRLPV